MNKPKSSVESILKYIYKALESGSDRFVILDEEHIMDTATGVEFHLFDDYFKVTHNGETIVSMPDFYQTKAQEQKIVNSIRELILDPEGEQERREKYHKDVMARRSAFVELYDNPKPAHTSCEELEEGTVEYTG